MGSGLWSAIWGGICGGMAAIIASFLTYKVMNFEKGSKKEKRAYVMISVLIFIGLFQGGKVARVPERMQGLFNPTYKLGVLMEQQFKIVLEHPAMIEAMKQVKTQEEADKLTATLVHLGLQKLPYEKLKVWNGIRLQMAKQSPAMCAGFWTGKFDMDLIANTIVALPKEDQDNWGKLSSEAAILQLDQKASPKIVQTDLGTGIQKIVEALPKEEQERAVKVLNSGLGAEDKEACWFMTHLLADSEKFDEEFKERFLRTLAAL